MTRLVSVCCLMWQHDVVYEGIEAVFHVTLYTDQHQQSINELLHCTAADSGRSTQSLFDIHVVATFIAFANEIM